MNRKQADERAQAILRCMTLKEKVEMLSGNMSRENVLRSIRGMSPVHYNEKPYRHVIKAHDLRQGLSLPEEMRFVDGSRGVVCGHDRYTCFPVSVLRGAAFDPDLEQKIGQAIAHEVIDAGGNFFGGICINVPYHPGWGRAQETYGEDPVHIGIMGSALLKGVQNEGVIGCIKHFAFNSMEEARFHVSVEADHDTEQDVFLRQFCRLVKNGAAAVMTAYNCYQGIMCGEHKYLIHDVLRTKWGFDGFVISDFTWGAKHTIPSIEAGLDIEMPTCQIYGEKLIEAVNSGRVSADDVDAACTRILRTLLIFEDIRKKNTYPKPDLKLHQQLALQCAREGITLVKNDGNILPFKTDTDRQGLEHILVLGRLAKEENTGDHGSSRVYAPYVVTPLEGIRKAFPDAEISYYDGANALHVSRLSKRADHVILIVGNDYYAEGEHVSRSSDDLVSKPLGGDRRTLSLSGQDLEMIRAVSRVRKDAVVVLTSGSTILMKEWQDLVGAILYQYYPGMEGGTALGEILSGRVTPGGKLPFVIPESIDDLPKMNFDADHIVYQHDHGYRLIDRNGKKPLYPYGFGLSYTTFRYEPTHADVIFDDKSKSVSIPVRIQNTGGTAGAEVLQVYDESHRLVGFKRVFLKPKEDTCVNIRLEEIDLASYRTDYQLIPETSITCGVGTCMDPETWSRVVIHIPERRNVNPD